MDELREYIEGVNAASARSRTALYVMIMASTLIGASVWNYRRGSWDNRHMEVVIYAARHLGDETADPGHEVLFEKAREYVSLIHREWQKDEKTEGVLLGLFETLRDQFHEKYGQIKVPILGIAFNPNDTGLIGGFALTVFLMILRLSLARENDTLKTTIDRAEEKGVLRPVYDVLRMTQVLSTPPQPSSPSHVPNRIWNSLHKWLFALPAIVQLCVVIADLNTFKDGWAICRLNTIVELVGGTIFLVAIIFLTLSCRIVSRSTDECWNKAYGLIQSKMPVVDAASP